MRITVIGAGAMGSLFGGGLAKNPDNDVLLVDTWPEHVRKLNADGLQLKRGKHVEQIKIRAAFPSEVTEPADLVIVFTKSQHTEAALEAVKSVFTQSTIALTLQNGLGNIEKLARYIPISQIIVGTTTIPSDVIEPGVIASEGDGDCKILDADGNRRSRTEDLVKLLNEAGLPSKITEDIFVSIWEKVAFNAALNALCAVTRLPVGGVGDTEAGQRLAMRVAEETISVANRKGIKANLEHCQSMIRMAFAEHKGHQPSMLQDVLAKRMTEISAINGAIANEAQKLGIATPVTATLADLVTIIQSNYE